MRVRAADWLECGLRALRERYEGLRPSNLDPSASYTRLIRYVGGGGRAGSTGGPVPRLGVSFGTSASQYRAKRDATRFCVESVKIGDFHIFEPHSTQIATERPCGAVSASHTRRLPTYLRHHDAHYLDLVLTRARHIADGDDHGARVALADLACQV
jgi:hypothetical protein